MEVELLGTTHWLLIALTCQVSASCFLEGCPSPISFGNNFEAYLPSDSPPFKIFPFRILTPLNILQTTTPCWNLSFYYTFEIPCEHSLSLSAFHWGPDCLSKKIWKSFEIITLAIPILARSVPNSRTYTHHDGTQPLCPVVCSA